MKDDLPWFKHYNSARNHPKMKALRGRFGPVGYGRFWMLNEIISEAPEARLDLSRKINLLSTAEELGLELAEFEEFLDFLSDPEIDLVNYSDGIVTTDQTQEDYSVVEGSRGRKREMGKTSAEKRQNAAEESQNAAEKTNRAEQSRAEQNRIDKSSSSARADDVSEEDPGLMAYALDQAKKAKARAPSAYARSLVKEPDVRAAYLETLQLKEQPDKRAPPPKTCQECGATMSLIAGDSVCPECGAAWSYSDEWQSWERTSENYERFDFAALRKSG